MCSLLQLKNSQAPTAVVHSHQAAKLHCLKYKKAVLSKIYFIDYQSLLERWPTSSLFINWLVTMMSLSPSPAESFPQDTDLKTNTDNVDLGNGPKSMESCVKSKNSLFFLFIIQTKLGVSFLNHNERYIYIFNHDHEEDVCVDVGGVLFSP